ncbi:MAG: hypothetical protein KFB96_01610 [Thiocapsa sp.]|uniref:hypothetical protein n=1 Tax=Thiocapsa sp. TaxID=2024551 RepID=UPI001BCC3EE1|nr:hypothetical protein [Thiocapsa sp.]QVL49253.1 MAG: hypothetical protein KFB96_01610 [Thiocapsa sp.]
MQSDLDPQRLKQIVKDALLEVLDEERDMLGDVLVASIEDLALAEAIRKGRTTDLVDRDAVLDVLGEKG